MASIGARIRKRRQALGMRQHELAAAVGVDRSAVSNWERGVHLPLRYLGKVEEVLGISLEEEEVRPRIPPDIEAAIRRSDLDPDFKDEFRSALEEVIRRRQRRGDPDVTLHGPLDPRPPTPSDPVHADALIPSPALRPPPPQIPQPAELPSQTA